MTATDRTAASDGTAIASVGAVLRRARNTKGLSREEVAQHLNIQLCQITALEEDRPDSLPPLAFAAGFVRSYARLVNLDAEQTVSTYKAQMGGILKGAATGQDFLTSRDLTMDNDSSARMIMMSVIFIALALLIAGAVGAGWTILGSNDDHRTLTPLAYDAADDKGVLPVAQTATRARSAAADAILPPSVTIDAQPQQKADAIGSTAPTTTTTTAAATTAPAASQIIDDDFGFTITALDVSWVRIKDADGIEIANQILRTGQQIHIEQRDRVTLTTGNFEGLSITMNGAPLPDDVKIMANAADNSMRSLVLDRTALLNSAQKQNF